MTSFVVTRLTKTSGPLTKRISLAADGTAKSDGSACTMAQGTAERLTIGSATQLANLIEGLASNQAIALGALQRQIPDTAEVITKRSLAGLNGSAAPSIIARTADYIFYPPETPAFVLLDFDTRAKSADAASL